MKKERFKLVSSVCLLLRKDDKVLLQLRRNTGWCDGCYASVGGGIEKNETALKAVVREAKEEIGITLQEQDLKVVHVLHFKLGHEGISFFIEATKWQGDPCLLEPEKCRNLSWFAVDDLPKNSVVFLPSIFKKINKRILYSEYGWD